MRISIVHSFYRRGQPSGENNLVLGQVEALKSMGHDVTLISRESPDVEPLSLYGIASGIRIVTGQDGALREAIADSSPDLIFLHNLFPNFGWRWIRDYSSKTVAFIHNYRFACASGNFFRDGSLCSRCIEGSRLAAVRYRCYRGSLTSSAPVAWSTRNTYRDHPVYAHVRHFVVGSTLSASIVKNWGVAPHQLRIIPNFVSRQQQISFEDLDGSWAFAGRWTAEKGILELMKDFPVNKTLKIFGGGPLVQEVNSSARENIVVGESLPNSELQDRLRLSWGIVVPSIWYEVNPVVAAEAFSRGQPVIALEGNATATELARINKNLVYQDAQSLKRSLSHVESRFSDVQSQMSDLYSEFYSFEAWKISIERLMDTVA